MDMTQNSTYD